MKPRHSLGWAALNAAERVRRRQRAKARIIAGVQFATGMALLYGALKLLGAVLIAFQPLVKP